MEKQNSVAGFQYHLHAETLRRFLENHLPDIGLNSQPVLKNPGEEKRMRSLVNAVLEFSVIAEPTLT